MDKWARSMIAWWKELQFWCNWWRFQDSGWSSSLYTPSVSRHEYIFTNCYAFLGWSRIVHAESHSIADWSTFQKLFHKPILSGGYSSRCCKLQYYDCPSGDARMLDSIELLNEDKGNKNIVMHEWFAVFSGCDAAMIKKVLNSTRAFESFSTCFEDWSLARPLRKLLCLIRELVAQIFPALNLFR